MNVGLWPLSRALLLRFLFYFLFCIGIVFYIFEVMKQRYNGQKVKMSPLNERVVLEDQVAGPVYERAKSAFYDEWF